ncbi:hypothetical protein [Leptolyngbya sp. 7M]|uniref:hypothetical protein n=1 Tax=Leptolyngbya sp. 7M TaxID=2812896 RepID=UPI001B8D7E3E|nr:hypothetical protein [Leptolyngbya sp. 7M]QYO68007.1 hypothetical protein JVX88_15265 [Leptolyngbya sp. 7M]
MTTSLPDRLDRIERILEQLVERTNDNTQQLGITMQAVDRMANVQMQVLEAFAQMQATIAEIQSEVRGLQSENRRILERLEN